MVFIVCSPLNTPATVKPAVPITKAHGVLLFIFIIKVRNTSYLTTIITNVTNFITETKNKANS
jgi:hypothetical protein